MLPLEQDYKTLNSLMIKKNQLPQAQQSQSQESTKQKLFLQKPLQSINSCRQIDKKNHKIQQNNYSKNNLSSQKDLLDRSVDQSLQKRRIILKANNYQEPNNQILTLKNIKRLLKLIIETKFFLKEQFSFQILISP
ncbi:hypothetical protein ABPG72_008086 [Tetrahymena utriculariae]